MTENFQATSNEDTLSRFSQHPDDRNSNLAKSNDLARLAALGIQFTFHSAAQPVIGICKAIE